MTEWRLWEGDKPPYFTTPEFFEAHPRIPGDHQVGYFERQDLVLEMLGQALPLIGGVFAVPSLSDLGCGDGTLLHRIHRQWPSLNVWGYDLGADNVAHAQRLGLQVSRRDLLEDGLFVGYLSLLTEVLEHMVDPHRYLRVLDARHIIATSPVYETDEWHYEHHAWAWDGPGFDALLRGAGWHPHLRMVTVARNTVVFGPKVEQKAPGFQCVFASREDHV